MKKLLGSVLVLSLSVTAYAAKPANTQKAVKPQKTSAARILKGEGVTFGGLAGTGFSLLNLNAKYNPKTKTERLVLDIGTLQGRPHKGWPAFYHAQLKPQQLIIDFSQMPNANIDAKALQQRFAKSKAVKSAKLMPDPVSGSMALVLDLKQKSKVKFYQVEGKKGTSKVVVDFLSL